MASALAQAASALLVAQRRAFATAAVAPVRKGHRVSLILKEQLDNLGYKGEEVQVAPGYARNFLIPQQLAVYATQANRDRFKVTLSEEEAKAASTQRAKNMLNSRIAAVTLRYKRATSDGKQLYGGVTAADISEGLMATPLRNLRIKESNVRLTAPSPAPAASADAAAAAPAAAAAEPAVTALKTVGMHTVYIEPVRAGYAGMWSPLKVHISSS